MKWKWGCRGSLSSQYGYIKIVILINMLIVQNIGLMFLNFTQVKAMWNNFTTAFALYNSVDQWYHLGFLLLEHQLLQRDFELTCQLCPPKMDNLKKKICLPTCTLYQQLVQNLLTAKFYLKIRYPSALFLSWIYDMKMWFVAITWIMCDKSVWSISCIPEINLGRMKKHNLVPCLIKHH